MSGISGLHAIHGKRADRVDGGQLYVLLYSETILRQFPQWCGARVLWYSGNGSFYGYTHAKSSSCPLFAGDPRSFKKRVSGRSLANPPATLDAAVDLFRSVRPSPSCDIRTVDTVFICVSPALDLAFPEFFLCERVDSFQAGNSINDVDRDAEAVDFIVHRQLHRRVDVALLLVATHVQALVVAGVGKAVNQPGITVEVEDDGFVDSEEGIKVRIRQSVRMLRAGLQLEQIHNVDETNLDVGELFP